MEFTLSLSKGPGQRAFPDAGEPQWQPVFAGAGGAVGGGVGAGGAGGAVPAPQEEAGEG
jgi:hypothetical protein